MRSKALARVSGDQPRILARDHRLLGENYCSKARSDFGKRADSAQVASDSASKSHLRSETASVLRATDEIDEGTPRGAPC